MSRIWTEASEIWLSGGWAMILLAINAFILSWIGVNVKLKLQQGEHHRIPESTWKGWIRHNRQRQGVVGELIGFAMGAGSLGEMENLFDEFRHVEIGSYDRELRMMQVCVSVSPLLGLLGTVTGMLTTFGALAIGTGGEQTMNMVAGGISEALITTETGLVIALPGLLLLHHLRQDLEKYQGFLAGIETACAQALHRKLSLSSVTMPEIPQPEIQPVPVPKPATVPEEKHPQRRRKSRPVPALTMYWGVQR